MLAREARRLRPGQVVRTRFRNGAAADAPWVWARAEVLGFVSRRGEVRDRPRRARQDGAVCVVVSVVGSGERYVRLAEELRQEEVR